jgi:hypothetical protein
MVYTCTDHRTVKLHRSGIVSTGTENTCTGQGTISTGAHRSGMVYTMPTEEMERLVQGRDIHRSGTVNTGMVYICTDHGTVKLHRSGTVSTGTGYTYTGQGTVGIYTDQGRLVQGWFISAQIMGR